MKTIQRHDNWVDSSWALIRVLYYFLGLPSLVFLAFASVIIYSNNGPSEPGSGLGFLFLFVWCGIIFPLGFRRVSIIRRRRQLKQMVTMLSSDERFSPQKHHQVMDAGRGKYLGVDIRSGNLLYIHMVKKGVVDVIGLTMRDWTDSELEGSTLRLNTRNPEVPVLSINAHPTVAKELFNTISAMSHKSYSESFPQEPWPEYVGRQSRFVEFEHNVVVPQVV
ncbi:plasmid IncI1-type surface exclusion protein ExcA [Pantoea sp. DY-5]|uniref:plasmid IncI1-type surface exclusion protein ExcA n=1 Tax=Pantoea sp. DY-5 TaxID=2871488 RepID=UPI001C98218E|nr:plasmid IncI1-type surface exclusion protein ExcA [Pantoea sp. DY-5]MBY4841107.1 plasmid IncI1-type surface exclusion protein ExcA [Pantoea sp. DY-5]